MLPAELVNSAEGYHYTLPGTSLSIHLTLSSTKTPLPADNTLVCLLTFAGVFKSEPQPSFLDRRRTHTTKNVQATIAPVKCLGCGVTFRESAQVLAGLWYYISRENLLYVQQYGVFDSRTGRMVASGTLLLVSPEPNTSGEMDMVSTPSSGLAETS